MIAESILKERWSIPIGMGTTRFSPATDLSAAFPYVFDTIGFFIF